MKKLCYIFVGLCFVLFISACNSTGITETNTNEITEVVESNTITTTESLMQKYQPYSEISSSELELLYKTELYDENMAQTTLADKALFKTYRGIWWGNADLENQLAYNEAHSKNGTSMIRYMAIGNEIFDIAISAENVISIDERYDELAPFLKDFQTIDTDVDILDQLCHVNEVICFNENYMEGILNYIVTDKGTYIKYYENARAEAMVFEESDFIIKASAYHAYRWDPETSHDKEGNDLFGFTTFKSFLADPYLVEKYIQETATE